MCMCIYQHVFDYTAKILLMTEIFGKIATVLEKIPHADQMTGFFEMWVGALCLIEGNAGLKVAGLGLFIHGLSSYSDVIRGFDTAGSNQS